MCKPCWPPEPVDLELFPGQQLQKLGLQMSIHTHFWVILVSCSEAEGEHKDGILQPTFPASTSIDL